MKDELKSYLKKMEENKEKINSNLKPWWQKVINDCDGTPASLETSYYLTHREIKYHYEENSKENIQFVKKLDRPIWKKFPHCRTIIKLFDDL